MCVIECGTIEEPENVLKALMDDNIDEVVRLLQVLGEEAYYWFTLTDVTGYDPRRYFEIYTNPEIKCRFSIVGMTLVFGSETMVRTVLDNVSKKCLTARCRMYVLDQNHQYMDMFAEYEAPFVLTKASLFHDPKKFHLLELMRKEYERFLVTTYVVAAATTKPSPNPVETTTGKDTRNENRLDLSVVAEVMSYYFERTENLDMKAENPWPFGDDDELFDNLDPPMDHFCRRRSILAAIAHELPLDMLDRYCKLYPHTLLPDGCFHLGRCLKVGDFDRLRVLFNNGLHHRPEYAKRKWLAKRPYDEFSEMNIVVMYTNNGKHELSEHDLVHLLSMQDIQIEGCSNQISRRIKHSELKLCFIWLAAFQLCGGYEFEFVDSPTVRLPNPFVFGLVGPQLPGFITLVRHALEEWKNQPKSLYFLARNSLRESIPMDGEFENHVREMIGCRPIEEGVGCNFHKMNEYFNVVSVPPERDRDD